MSTVQENYNIWYEILATAFWNQNKELGILPALTKPPLNQLILKTEL